MSLAQHFWQDLTTLRQLARDVLARAAGYAQPRRARSLPAYVNRPTGYDISLAGPYLQKDVNLRAYVFRADGDALQRTCDRYLNEPQKPFARFEYRPLYPAVLLTMLNLGKVSAGDPGLGYMHEIDGAFQFLVRRFDERDPLGLHIATFMPYLWVNNDWAMATGREPLGFRKEMATFTNGDDENAKSAADLRHIDAWAVSNKGQALQIRRLVAIHEASLAYRRDDSWRSPHDLVDAALNLLGPLGANGLNDVIRALAALKTTAAVHLPIAFLKQIRDAYDPTSACVQEVFETMASIPLSRFSGGIVPGTHRVDVNGCASHPILQELGLGTGGITDTLTASVVMDFDCDVVCSLPTRA